MKKVYLCRVFVLLALLLNTNPILLAQKGVPKWIEKNRKNGDFADEKIVQSSKNTTQDAELKKGTSLTIDDAKLSDLWKNPRATVTLTLPVQGRSPISVELARIQVTTADFKVSTSITLTKNSNIDEGVHYRGVVKGDTASVVAISIYQDEMRGFISDTTGKYEIGKIKNQNSSEHVIYETNDLQENQPFVCGSNAESKARNDLGNTRVGATGIGCKTVKVFFECDYQMFLDNGSKVVNVVNYVTSFFNQVATIYQNEDIDIQISEIYVWSTPDPYRALTSTGAVLSAYDTNRGSNFNGNLAHFLTTRNLGGGIAYLDVLCNKSYAHGVSMIYNTFATYPTYSWTVNCITHELGHNFGSNHTQWCGWARPGGTTGPIDNCVAPEGSCTTVGATPTNGGTIMSYCHQTAYGVNFTNGFGTLPGNSIRLSVTNATCLAETASATSAPTGQQTTNILDNGATLTWNAVPNVSNYAVDYKPSSAATWITFDNASATTVTLSGLLTGTSYDWRVKGDCSGYSTTSSFTTTGTASCAVPTGLASSNIDSTSATLSWGTVSGATDYTVQYKTSAATTWTTAETVTTNAYSLTGLTANTVCNWQVKASCSAYSAIASLTTICSAPVSLANSNIATTSATLSWGAVSGATNYTVQYKTSAATTWTTATAVTTNSLNLTRLTAGTAYNWQVKASCSGYSAIASLTTLVTPCTAPAKLLSSNIASNSATLSWGAVTGATDYTIQYKTSTATTWTTAATVTTITYNITGLAGSTAYNWQVKASCSAYSAIASLTTICSAPVSLANSNIATTSATLSWDAVGGATNYTVQYKTSSATSWTTATAVTTNAINLKGLIANTAYNWQVKASCSGYSPMTSLRTLCTSPASLASSNITATSATLTWGAVTGATNYTIQYKTSTETTWTTAATVTTNSYSLTGLTKGTAYNWQVAASCSAYSAIASLTTLCDAPINLVSSNIASTSATLSWDAVGGATNYTVQYKTSSATSWTTATAVTTNAINLKGLIANTAYNWQVKASCSGYSPMTSLRTLCTSPASLASSNITATSATLTWGAVTGATNYTIQYKTSTDTTWTTAATVTTNSYSLTGLTKGTAYNWQVAASCSAYSAIASLTTLCDAPINLVSSNIASTSATLSWDAVGGATNYTVQYKTSSATSWTTATAVTTNAINLKGLIANTAYNWQVKASCSGYSPMTSLRTLCTSPASLASSNITATSATLTWGAVTGATNYTIQYKTSTDTTWTTAATVTTNSYSLTGLTKGTAYNWQVAASCSAYSAIASLTTLCDAPINLVSSNIASTSATLSWDAVGGATNYTVQYKTSSATSWTTATAVTTNAINLTGLIANTAYNWQVKASCSGYSPMTSLRTLCASPASLASSNITATSATLTWGAVTGATNYTIQYKTSTDITWTTAATVTTNSYSLTGLAQGTTYNWQVATICSVYSAIASLSTTCSAPISLVSSNIASTSATLSWGAVSGATNYTVQFKKSSARTWTTAATVTTNTYNLTGLTANTAYNWQVKAICSGYSAIASLTTFAVTAGMDALEAPELDSLEAPELDSLEIKDESVYSTPIEVPKFSVYPNPAQDIIVLSITNDDERGKKTYFRIVDFKGNIRIVQEIKEMTETIDISNLERGTYIIQMFSKSEVIESKTLIKEQ